MSSNENEGLGVPKAVLGLASFFSAAVVGQYFQDEGYSLFLGVVLGFFGYALCGIATLKLNQAMWKLAFGDEEDWTSRQGRAWFIALWPLATGVAVTICPIVILVNAVI